MVPWVCHVVVALLGTPRRSSRHSWSFGTTFLHANSIRSSPEVSVAQLVERTTEDREAGGSKPPADIFFYIFLREPLCCALACVRVPVDAVMDTLLDLDDRADNLRSAFILYDGFVSFAWFCFCSCFNSTNTHAHISSLLCVCAQRKSCTYGWLALPTPRFGVLSFVLFLS